MTAFRRSRTDVSRCAWAALLAVASTGWAIGACQGGTPAARDTSLVKGVPDTATLIPGTTIQRLRECPHEWKRFVGQFRGGGPDSALRAVGERTDVVEYHDCQKFIARGEYKQLVAIFAGVAVTRTPNELAAARAESPIALASALVLNFDEPYKNLGLESGFNCLYVYYGGGDYIAKVKSFGGEEPDCQPPADINELPVTPRLKAAVSELPAGSAGGYNAGDVPAVARWMMTALQDRRQRTTPG